MSNYTSSQVGQKEIRSKKNYPSHIKQVQIDLSKLTRWYF
jgi:hypothetical protein